MARAMLNGHAGKAQLEGDSRRIERNCLGLFCLNHPSRANLMLGRLRMIFTTYWFLVFVVVAVGGFHAVPGPRWRLLWLAAACATFHIHFAGPAGVLPIIVLMIITFLAGRTGDRKVCAWAMAVCVSALCFYKYALFLIAELVGPLSPGLSAGLDHAARALMPGAPPLGISFFTFEFVHYLFEVRRGGEPIRSPLRFLLFSIFFPSLVAGPIKRYAQFLPSLEAAAKAPASLQEFSAGLMRVGVGFAKKILVADQLTLYIDRWQPHFSEESLLGRWVILAAIAFRILMDFSGYSDIAIGCAQTLGIRLPENFNWPYLAHNLQEFWQRWHISLASWLRDYVYIPLGGSRHGWSRRILSGMAAFALCGLWHGPAWHYVVWGLYHGAGLAVCVTYERIPVLGPRLALALRKEPMAGRALTLVFAWLGWLVFFYPVNEAVHMAGQLFGQ
jgi:alginate O-acetyltransferase complex protein AlgI